MNDFQILGQSVVGSMNANELVEFWLRPFNIVQVKIKKNHHSVKDSGLCDLAPLWKNERDSVAWKGTNTRMLCVKNVTVGRQVVKVVRKSVGLHV